MWLMKDGWLVGVIMFYVFDDGCFWFSVLLLRVCVKVVECEFWILIFIISKGSLIMFVWSLMYKGMCEVFRD